ncbi:hypothetical protein ACO0LL_04465 [Undibacterium sp. TC4M20W]|uniref:hypothetical protein n=1 Tax=Undibacterium sp. TC4M20W TaxID=3413052 RepID=UPI003BEFC543
MGDEQFVEKYQHQPHPEDLRDISIAHRRAIAQPLYAYQGKFPDRNEAMAQAYRSGDYTMAEIAAFFRSPLCDSQQGSAGIRAEILS